jgi:outer membrane biosynthesis protein TonB
MKNRLKNFTLIVLYFTISILHAQVNKNEIHKQNSNPVVNNEPFYPKGDAALFNAINNELKFSEEAKASRLSGKVVLSFDIKPDSAVVNPSIISGIGNEIDQQILFNILKYKFAPAQQNGYKTKMNIMIEIPIKAH